MDCPTNHKETTVGCDSVSDNNNIISLLTEENLTKGSSEGLDDFRYCEDWVEYNFDADQSESVNDWCIVDHVETNDDDEMSSEKKSFPPNNNNNWAENVTKTFKSSKNHTENLGKLLEKLLENLDYNILYLNFTKLHQFLENDQEEICFPFISKQYEQVFEMIVLDVNILKSKSVDASYRSVCNKIMNAVNSNKSVYKLACVYEYRKDFRDVLVVRKIYFKKEPKEHSLSSSMESLPQPTESTSGGDPKKLPKRFTIPPTISKGFKIHCLRASLAFVKNDVTNKMEFPELSSDQAEFMRLLLESAIACTNFDRSFESIELYRDLWEAIKIYNLKYDFKITTLETGAEKKNLVFEKILKQKSAAPVENPNRMTVLEFQNKQRQRPTINLVNSNSLANSPYETLMKSDEMTINPNLMTLMKKATAPLPIQSKKKTKSLNRAQKKEKKRSDIVDFVNSLPPEFVQENLNDIIDFLTIEETGRLDFVPANEDEQKFFRNAIHWARMTLQCTGLKFEGEHKRLFEAVGLLLIRMICKVKRDGMRLENGIREVTYIKKPKILSPPDVPKTSQSLHTRNNNKRKNSINSDTSTERSTASVGKSVSKRKKLKLQNIVKPDGTIEITVKNPGGSLRKKKKNKRLKNAKLDTTNDKLASVGLSNKISFKPAQQDRSDTDASGSERGTSLDRKKRGFDAQNVPKSTQKKTENTRASIMERERPSMRDHRVYQQLRKEQLIEALSVPVQCDKAMKMMRCMGWSGGALGARGNGITEPIMPAIDMFRGAGFGHTKNPSKLTIGNTAKAPFTIGLPKTVGNWPTETPNAQNETPKQETDIIVQKTKQLLQENCSFDTLMEKDVTKQKTIFSASVNFRIDLLKSILELLQNDLTSITLKVIGMSKKHKSFVRHVTRALGTRSRFNVKVHEQALVDHILKKYNELPGVLIEGSISAKKEVTLKKVHTFSDDQMKHLKTDPQKANTDPHSWATPITEMTDESIISFLNGLQPPCESKKAYRALKFRVLIMLKILDFIKSDEEEFEVVFNKVLGNKQKTYIESSIESINSRIRFGSSPAELGLSVEVKKYIGETFFGIMFNHHYTSFTLIKYSRTKRPNKSTSDDKKNRKSTCVNLEDFNCDSSCESFGNTQENTDQEIHKTTENNNNEDMNKGADDKNINDTDVENNKNTDIENSDVNDKKHDETTNIKDNKKFAFDLQMNNPKIYAADTEKAFVTEDTKVIKNKTVNSIKNKTDDKNNITSFKASEITDNGNVVVDNNENQVVDMKNDIVVNENVINKTETDENNIRTIIDDDDDEKAVSPAKTEAVIVKPEMINVTNNKKIDDKNAEAIENSEIGVITSNDDIEKVDQNQFEISTSDNNKEIDDVSIDSMTEEMLLQTEDITDIDFVSSDDSMFKGDHSENTDDDILNVYEDIVMKEVNAVDDIVTVHIDEPMKEIGIEEPKEMINKAGDSSKIDSENITSMDNDENKVATGANLKQETDCDSVLNQNIVLSEVHCDNERLVVSDFGKVLNLKGENLVNTGNCDVDKNPFKNSEIKNVYVVPSSYPSVKVTKLKAKEIQILISENILKTNELPQLMCHGVQNGALIYTCYNKKTFDWLKNTINVASELKVLDTKDVRKMALKFYCLFPYDIKYLFSMIELYNKELSTKEWVVEKSEFHDEYAIFLVKMDKYSINYIHASNLALFAGVDKVEFSLIWD